VALTLRLLFLFATPDAGWAHSAWYKGDAATWLEWARALQESRPFEADLPIRPPGAATLIAAVWDGTSGGIVVLKVLWCLLGALTVVPLYLAVRRIRGPSLAAVFGFFCAGSTGLMVLSTSLNNEAPYLLLVALCLWLTERIRVAARTVDLAAWGLVNALACLFRAEHVLFTGLVLLVLVVFWTRSHGEAHGGHRKVRLRMLIPAGVFVLILVPWHMTAWSQVRRFNRQEPRISRATEQAQSTIEQLLAAVPWSPEALSELDGMPAAVRRTTRLFVTATEVVRGGDSVDVRSLDVLDQAFGYRPEPLASHPFIALYGGLNFFLANNSQATDGFSRRVLESRPRLAGGAGRYPTPLVVGLPPPQLSLTYPPHLQAVNRGYRMGWKWIRDNPGEFLALSLRKMRVFWRGAALGLGGYNAPLGLSGSRRQVDLVVPVGAAAAVWRGGLLVLVLAGAWLSRRDPGAVPWLLFIGSKLIVTVAFFGYARQGASVIPVVALLVCAALARAWLQLSERLQPSPVFRRTAAVMVAVVILTLAAEASRFASRPNVAIDGRSIEATVPFPAHEHADRSVEVD
jgi:hypothetical protein